MSISSGIAIYFLIWWTALFVVLPWGVRSQVDTGEVVPGSEPGAPVLVRFGWIVFINTLLSTLIFIGFYFIWHGHLISLDDIPFLPVPRT